MTKNELEKMVEHLSANMLLFDARFEALENIMWGFMKVEIDAMEQGAGNEYKAMFYQFYAENLTRLKTQLPSTLATPVVLKRLQDELLKIDEWIDEVKDDH